MPVSNLSLAVNFNEDPAPMVQMLLEAGTDPAEDFPAIHDAIEKGNLEVVELLAQYGADVDGGLQSAVMYNQIDIVRLLLNYGADPNRGVRLARTTYNAHMLKLLEEAGATIDRRPRSETHPEDYIKTEGGKRFGYINSDKQHEQRRGYSCPFRYCFLYSREVGYLEQQRTL